MGEGMLNVYRDMREQCLSKTRARVEMRLRRRVHIPLYNFTHQIKVYAYDL